MKVFVTVGTTKFDSLIRQIFTSDVQSSLIKQNYKRLTIQIGNSHPPKTEEKQDSLLAVDEIYQFKPNLIEDFQASDLIIAHAGAGTCLEVLSLKKPLIVVINDQLMGNHQTELAERLAQDNHLVYCTCSTLAETIANFNPNNLEPYHSGNIDLFTHFLDDFMSNGGGKS